jgi:hypothetical protein
MVAGIFLGVFFLAGGIDIQFLIERHLEEAPNAPFRHEMASSCWPNPA